MKKYLLILMTLILSVFWANAKQASCSSNDGVSYVTVSTEACPSPGATYFNVRGYGQYKNATVFITYKLKDSNNVKEITVDVKDGKGRGFSSWAPEKEITDLKVTVASFCK